MRKIRRGNGEPDAHAAVDRRDCTSRSEVVGADEGSCRRDRTGGLLRRHPALVVSASGRDGGRCSGASSTKNRSASSRVGVSGPMSHGPCATTRLAVGGSRSRRTRRGRRPPRSRRGTSAACSRVRVPPHLGGRCEADVRSCARARSPRRPRRQVVLRRCAHPRPRSRHDHPVGQPLDRRTVVRPRARPTAPPGGRRRRGVDAARRARRAARQAALQLRRARSGSVRPSTIVLKRSAGHSSTCGSSAASVPPTARTSRLSVGHGGDVQRDDPAGRRGDPGRDGRTRASRGRTGTYGWRYASTTIRS